MTKKDDKPDIGRQYFCLPVLLLLLALVPALPKSTLAYDIVTMTAQKDTSQKFLHIMAENGNDPARIDSIPPEKNFRVVAEMVIIAKALQLGGMNPRFKFIIVPNARRETHEVVQGSAVMASQQFNIRTFEERDYKQNAFMSSPVTRPGEFCKGFYCRADNKKALRSKTIAEINRLKPGVIGLHWNNDAAVLADMGLKPCLRAPRFDSLIKMVENGRADWAPLTFSRADDLSRQQFGVTLVPIPGIRFSLLQSRHFMVSRTHPMGPKTFCALQKGLAKLRKRGAIRKLLTDVGFFNDATEGWTMLNADAVPAVQ